MDDMVNILSELCLLPTGMTSTYPGTSGSEEEEEEERKEEKETGW